MKSLVRIKWWFDIKIWPQVSVDSHNKKGSVGPYLLCSSAKHCAAGKAYFRRKNNNKLQYKRKAERFQTCIESLPQRQVKHKDWVIDYHDAKSFFTFKSCCSINRPSLIQDFSRLTFQYLAVSVHTECKKSLKWWVSTRWFFLTAILIVDIDRRNM